MVTKIVDKHLFLEKLSGFASFLLQYHLEDLSAAIETENELREIPLVRHLQKSGLNLATITKQSLSKFLLSVINKTIIVENLQEMKSWKNGNHPFVDPELVESKDIALVHNVRKQVIIDFIPKYTKDPILIIEIIKELEGLYSHLEENAYNTYSEVQQKKITREKEFNEVLINNNLDGIISFDKELMITSINKPVLVKYRLLKKEVIGKKIWSVWPEIKEDIHYLYAVLKGRTIKIKEKSYKNGQGFYEANLVPFQGENSEIEGGIIFIHDITERIKYETALKEHTEELKVANEQLRESQEELQSSIEDLKKSKEAIEETNEELQELLAQLEEAQEAIIESETRLLEAQEVAHLGSWEWDVYTDQVRWSAEMKKIFGYSDEYMSIDYQSYLSHIHPEDKDNMKEVISVALKNKSNYAVEHRIISKDGKIKWMLGKGRPVFKNGKLLKLTGTGYDITAQKESEEAMKKSRDYYLTILEDFPSLIWRAGIDGKCNYFNNTWLDWTGRSLSEEYGDGWTSGIHPEDVDNCRKTFTDAFNKREKCTMEYRLLKYEGTYGWILNMGKPLYDPDGNFTGYIGSSFDITEDKIMKAELVTAFNKIKEKNNELTKAEILLRELNQNLEDKVFKRTVELQDYAIKLKTKNDQLVQLNDYMDNFVYAAAHDLKAPVANLKLLSQVLKKPSDEAERYAYFSTMDQIVERLEKTMDGLVQIMEIQSNVNNVIKKVEFDALLNLVQTELKTMISNSEVEIFADFSNANHINFFEPFLQSVMRNLISNSIKYSSDKRKSKVKIKTYHEGPFIIMEFEDNGIGIDLKKYGKNMFKPFYRFTQRSEGKGIGLHLIKSMVEKNGGKIEVKSEINEGTRFKIYLREYISN
jgi:PAS domain S-box-containing protein